VILDGHNDPAAIARLAGCVRDLLPHWQVHETVRAHAEQAVRALENTAFHTPGLTLQALRWLTSNEPGVPDYVLSCAHEEQVAICVRYAWQKRHLERLQKDEYLPHPFQCRVPDRAEKGSRSEDLEFYALECFLPNFLTEPDLPYPIFKKPTHEEKFHPDFVIETKRGGTPLGVEITQIVVESYEPERTAHARITHKLWESIRSLDVVVTFHHPSAYLQKKAYEYCGRESPSAGTSTASSAYMNLRK